MVLVKFYPSATGGFFLQGASASGASKSATETSASAKMARRQHSGLVTTGVLGPTSASRHFSTASADRSTVKARTSTSLGFR